MSTFDFAVDQKYLPVAFEITRLSLAYAAIPNLVVDLLPSVSVA